MLSELDESSSLTSTEPSYPLKTGMHLRDDIQVLIAIRNAIMADRRYLSCRRLISEEAEALTQISGHGGGGGTVADLSPQIGTLSRLDPMGTMNSASNVVLPAGHAVMRSSSFHSSTMNAYQAGGGGQPQSTATITSPGVIGRYRNGGPSVMPPFVTAPVAVASSATMNPNNEMAAVTGNAYASCPSGMVNGISQLKPYATYAGTVSLLSKRSSAISKWLNLV